MGALAELSPLAGTVAACGGLNLSRASYYRTRFPRISTVKPSRKVARALVASERQPGAAPYSSRHGLGEESLAFALGRDSG